MMVPVPSVAGVMGCADTKVGTSKKEKGTQKKAFAFCRADFSRMERGEAPFAFFRAASRLFVV
jgi:hypothetical protein